MIIILKLSSSLDLWGFSGIMKQLGRNMVYPVGYYTSVAKDLNPTGVAGSGGGGTAIYGLYRYVPL